MKIPLSDKYTLVSDELNVYITQIVYSKEDVAREEVFGGYHGCLEHCLLSFARRKINLSQAETLQQLVKDVEAVNKEIKGFCKNLKKLERGEDVAVE